MYGSLKKITLALVGLFVLIQLIRPARTNPFTDPAREISAHESLDAAVAATLARSCNDCHSNRTVWPWYSSVAPASWLVAYDIRKGRDELNFSEWGTYSPEKRAKLLKDICQEVSEGEMPGLAYTLAHPGARVSQAEAQATCRWTRAGAAQENLWKQVAASGLR